jgi:hypothetical protein
MGGKFYSNVWMKGGREIADEAIKKNEKESYDAREEAKRAEEAAERARRIGPSKEEGPQHRATKVSPFELFYGQEVVLRVEISLNAVKFARQNDLVVMIIII